MKKFSSVGLVLLFVSMLWGVNPPIMKMGLEYVPPLPYNTLRMIFAAITAWGIVCFSKTYQKIEKEDWKTLLSITMFGFFIFQIFFTICVDLTTSGNVALITGLLPLDVAFVNTIFRIERISMRTVEGMVISFLGVVLIILGSGKEVSLASNHLWGVLLLLLGQIFFAYYMVFSKKLLKKYPSSLIMAHVITISSFFFVLVSIKGLMAVDWGNLSQTFWLSNLYSGIFAICVGNFLWTWGVKKIGSTHTAIYNNLTLVFMILSGCLMLGERFGLVQFVGAVIIFTGLYVTKNKKEQIPNKVVLNHKS